jgi:hypothetical protein
MISLGYLALVIACPLLIPNSGRGGLDPFALLGLKLVRCVFCIHFCLSALESGGTDLRGASTTIAC